jgi:hypothetical protein
MGGAAIGFLGALFIYQIGFHIDHLENEKIKRENTLHVYQLYKDELNMNSEHLKHLIEKQWIPFYKLKSVTRNSLWGQLADYSRDIALMKKLNYIYGELELINNKFEIMNAARLALISAISDEDKAAYQQEINSQRAGSIELGENVIPHIDKAISKIDNLIKKAKNK